MSRTRVRKLGSQIIHLGLFLVWCLLLVRAVTVAFRIGLPISLAQLTEPFLGIVPGMIDGIDLSSVGIDIRLLLAFPFTTFLAFILIGMLNVLCSKSMAEFLDKLVSVVFISLLVLISLGQVYYVFSIAYGSSLLGQAILLSQKKLMQFKPTVLPEHLHLLLVVSGITVIYLILKLALHSKVSSVLESLVITEDISVQKPKLGEGIRLFIPRFTHTFVKYWNETQLQFELEIPLIIPELDQLHMYHVTHISEP